MTGPRTLEFASLTVGMFDRRGIPPTHGHGGGSGDEATAPATKPERRDK